MPRELVRRWRAVLFQVERDGVEGKRFGRQGADVMSALLGFAAFVLMVEPDKGGAMLARARAAADGLGGPTAPAPAAVPAPPPPTPPTPGRRQPSRRRSGWQFWRRGR
ncbi:MAG: hypothetical protein R3F59_19175 [Myxococcota bacterium]